MADSHLLNSYYALRKTLLDPIAWWMSRQELHSFFLRTTPKGIVRAMLEYEGRGHYRSIRAVQEFEEIVALAQLVKDKQPQSIVEIGTRKGGSLFVWSRIARMAEKIISIDLPGGMFGGGYPEVRQRLYREFVADRPHTEMVLLRKDSQMVDTQKQVKQLLNGVPLDFLFIDGDHRYEGVKRDFELYESLVAPGGLIGFHDILPHLYHPECGVDQFWDEIKTGYRNYEFVCDPRQGRYGIGVLVKP